MGRGYPSSLQTTALFPASDSATLGVPKDALSVRKTIQRENNRLTERLDSGIPDDA